MPLNKAAFAIDGALTDALLARVDSYAGLGGAEGIISLGDLKVSALDVAGWGFKVGAGAASVRNRYQAKPNQNYTVVDEGGSTVDSSAMPPVNPAATSHLVAVVVGDTDFSQTGHPFMPPTIPAGQELTFEYVRYVVIPNVPSTTTKFSQLNKAYPAYAIARLDLPAGANTVTSGRIVDLRKVARPRVEEDVFTASQSADNQLGNVVNAFENWPNSLNFDTEIPEWAAQVIVTGYIESAIKTKAGVGTLRITIDDVGSSAATNLNEPAPTGATDRVGWNVGGKIAIPAAARGTTKRIRMQGKVNDTPSKSFLDTDTYTGGLIRVRYEESAV